MTHPSNRAERRHQRDRVIAARRFVYTTIWAANSYETYHSNDPMATWQREDPEWGRYAKWNLNCGSPGCHREKYYGPKRKRREALKHAGQDDF